MRELLAAGARIGRYELLLPAARGGMAEVWAARLHGVRGFQKLVAVKLLREEFAGRERSEEMFFEEARLASKLHHPNVVETFELGESDSGMHLVMEWVDGESLRQIQRDAGGSPLPLTVAVNLIAQCCRGLHAAHELEDEAGRSLGLVHRDVSPHNIMVTYDGIAKLTDFGVAKVESDEDQELTRAGEVKGKVPYMAPEYIAGKPVDRRADLFALGLVLYELTTGKHPFRGETSVQTVRNLCQAEAAPPRRFVPGYPTALSAVVRRAIKLEPQARFSTALDFLAMLQEAMPDAFGREAELQVAAYLGRLLKPRADARHEALQVALRRPSQVSAVPPDGPSGQSGTIGAVVTDDDPLPAVPAVVARSGSVKPALFGAAMALAVVAVGGLWGNYYSILPLTVAAEPDLTNEGASAGQVTQAAAEPVQETTPPLEPASTSGLDSDGPKVSIASGPTVSIVNMSSSSELGEPLLSSMSGADGEKSPEDVDSTPNEAAAPKKRRPRRRARKTPVDEQLIFGRRE